MRAAAVALLLAPLLAGGAFAEPVVGRLGVDLPGLRLSAAGPVVVYLEPVSGSPVPARGADAARVRQRHARFQPGFLVVAVGQPVEMTNDDTIFHNVFSYSRQNAFDLGLYPGGESRVVVFEHPGLVRTYCSIHESMNGAIFVAPTPWFARVDARGEFRIEGVPPGNWVLRTFSERLPASEQAIVVAEGSGARVELRLPTQSSAAPERKRSVSAAGTGALTR